MAEEDWESQCQTPVLPEATKQVSDTGGRGWE